MRRTLFLVAVSAGALAAASSSQGAMVHINVQMTGDQEVPGPGDASGSASGQFIFDTTANTVSWDVTYSNLTNVFVPADLTGFHIHVGGEGVGGGVVVNLGLGSTDGFGTLDGTVAISPALMNDIMSNPSGYYVNLHTSLFPAGAVRGQLPAPGAAVALLGGMALVTRRRR